MYNGRLKADFDEMIKNDDYTVFKDKRFFITGATGLIGSLLTKFLLYLNYNLNTNITIFAAARNTEKAKSILGDYEKLNIVKMDFDEDIQTPDINVDYIIHTAAVTTSKVMVQKPVETICAAINGTNAMLKYAQKKNAAFIYLSSMEAYGTVDTVDKKVSEKDIGYIDLSNVRSCYPESKRLCECLCRSYYEEYNVRTMALRLAQTFGAGVSSDDNRVFAQFTRSAMKGTPIVLHTAGKSEGNYVYTSDALRAILFLLISGQSGETYNITNEENHLTIADMAKLVSDTIGNGKCKVIFDIPQDAKLFGYAPDTKLFMSAEKINKLGWKANISLPEAYKRLECYFRESL